MQIRKLFFYYKSLLISSLTDIGTYLLNNLQQERSYNTYVLHTFYMNLNINKTSCDCFINLQKQYSSLYDNRFVKILHFEKNLFTIQKFEIRYSRCW